MSAWRIIIPAFIDGQVQSGEGYQFCRILEVLDRISSASSVCPSSKTSAGVGAMVSSFLRARASSLINEAEPQGARTLLMP